MPLHAQDVAAGDLDGLDGAVGRATRDHQPLPHLVDDLVVQRVHLELPAVERRRKRAEAEAAAAAEAARQARIEARRIAREKAKAAEAKAAAAAERAHKKELARRRKAYAARRGAKREAEAKAEAARQARRDARRRAREAAELAVRRAAIEARKEELRAERASRTRKFSEERREQREKLLVPVFGEPTKIKGGRERLLDLVERLRKEAVKKNKIPSPSDDRTLKDPAIDKPGFDRTWRYENNKFEGVIGNVRIGTTLRTMLDLEDIVFRAMGMARRVWQTQRPETFFGFLTLLSVELGDGSGHEQLMEKKGVPLIQSFMGIGNSRSLENFEDTLVARLESILEHQRAGVCIEAVTITGGVRRGHGGGAT